ncbi:STAS domain-containing protein [Aquabacterium sp.]|uniref:STAS domain-containing protein n=1 Tax=Aquabacterium sp. TaxID=1872578 RepID=UPI002C5ABFE4|nr:STAS domain-containing protein [Aquabacterium sp.]HSW03992.1 STAS domain-containing protein [Aquabacterium sp.]
MNATLEQRGALHCLRLEGELCIVDSAPAKAALLQALDAAAELDIDLAGVSAIDTAGLQLLIAAKRAAGTAGKTLRLVGHSAPALELIELYDLASWFGDPLVLPATSAGVAA